MADDPTFGWDVCKMKGCMAMLAPRTGVATFASNHTLILCTTQHSSPEAKYEILRILQTMKMSCWLVRLKHPHLDNWETDGPSVLPMGLAPVVVRMSPMVAGPWGLSAPHFGTSYQGYSSARMTSDSSVEKCGGANEVSCDWVRLHIFVAGKVNDKARVKLAKGCPSPLPLRIV